MQRLVDADTCAVLWSANAVAKADVESIELADQELVVYLIAVVVRSLIANGVHNYQVRWETEREQCLENISLRLGSPSSPTSGHGSEMGARRAPKTRTKTSMAFIF